jgi:hypothetical protein
VKDEKELSVVIKDKQEIKLCQEENKSTNSPSGVELSITKCPISCNNCKTVYSNKLTGIKIRCWCSCHFVVTQEVS